MEDRQMRNSCESESLFSNEEVGKFLRNREIQETTPAIIVKTDMCKDSRNIVTSHSEEGSRNQDNNTAEDMLNMVPSNLKLDVKEPIAVIPRSGANGNMKKVWRKVLKESDNEMHAGFEAVLMELGDPGKFFWMQFFFQSLTTFCLANTTFVYVFIGYAPPSVCKKFENESLFLARHQLHNTSGYEVNYGKCDITVLSNRSGVLETVARFGCEAGHDYHGNKHISFVSEWDMVCDRVGLRELVHAILMFGQTVGALIFTSFADKYGRKPVYVVCNLLLGVAGFGVAYAPNIYVMIAFRFLCGFFQQGALLVASTIRAELLTSKNRRVVVAISAFHWAFAIVVFGFTAYFMRHASWRALLVLTALLSSSGILSAVFLYESPRWLCANKKYTLALAIIKKACQTNKRDYEKVKDVFERHVVQPQQAKELGTSTAARAKVERYSMLDIVRHRSLFLASLILFFIWMSNSLTYNGLYLSSSSSLAGDRHLNFIFLALTELPGNIVNLFLLAFFGRKPVIMGWLLIAGTGLLIVTLLMAFGSTQITSTFSIVFACIGKLGIAVSLNSMMMYTPELFPTNLRSAGLGVCSSVSKFGGMVAPYSQALADVVVWGPGVIFSIMSFLSAILFTLLPETRGQPMPETITDMKQLLACHYGNKKHIQGYEDEVLEPQEVSI